MFIPAGIPDPANVRTSRDVKSGFRNVSFSKVEGQGSFLSISGAESKRASNFFDISLLTIATKPSNSPLEPAGSLYVSMKPMYL